MLNPLKPGFDNAGGVGAVANKTDQSPRNQPTGLVEVVADMHHGGGVGLASPEEKLADHDAAWEVRGAVVDRPAFHGVLLPPWRSRRRGRGLVVAGGFLLA